MIKSFFINKINSILYQLNTQNNSFLQNIYAWYLFFSEIFSYKLKTSKRLNYLKHFLYLKYLLLFNKQKLDPKMYELTVFPEYAIVRYYKSFMRGFFWALLLFYCYYSIPQMDGVKSIKKALKIFYSTLF